LPACFQMPEMKFESMPGGGEIPLLGLGTYGMGGGMSPSYSQDEKIVHAIRTAIELGYTHIDTAEIYASGHTEELVGRAIKDINRAELLIATKVKPANLRYQDVLAALQGSLKRLDTDYVDLYLIHWPNSSIPLEETFRALNELVARGQVRRLGVSNFSLNELKRARELSETPLVTNQVPYSVYERRYVRNGVLEYCQQNGIILTAYTPIEKGRVARDAEIQAIAEKHAATPVQVALSWLIRQPQVVAIPMSTNPKHLEENLGALDVELSEEDFERLDRLA
ncbi:MAG TPA: aldo/keto reductase, partial [Anaerolineales bacterium]